MGNQALQPGAPETLSHFTFYHPKLKRYLSVRWDKRVHVQAFSQESYSLFQACLWGEEPTAVGADWESLVSKVIALRILGAKDDAPGRYMTVTENGNITGGDQPSPWVIEREVVEEDGSLLVRLRYATAVECPGGLVCPASAGMYVQIQDAGLVRLKESRDTTFQMKVCTLPEKKVRNSRKISGGIASMIKLPEELDMPPANVTEADIEHYNREGYVICRGLLTPEQVERAKAKIQQGLDEGAVKFKGILGNPGVQRWPKSYRRSPEVLSLMTDSPAMSNCEALSGNVCSVPKEGQIALRRKTEDGSKDFGVGLDWHIDGYDKVTAARFGVLVVVALSDWDEDYKGNFTAYPGSHVEVAKKMKEMSWMEFQKFFVKATPLGIEPRQLHARTGDVIFAHPLLAHDVAVNKTDDVRWAVIFRTGFVQQHKRRQELLDADELAN